VDLDVTHRIRAVLFDLDETLIEASDALKTTHLAVATRIASYLRERGARVDEAETVSKLEKFDDRMNLDIKYNRDEWWSSFLAELGAWVDIPADKSKELTLLYWNTYADNTRPFPDAEPTIKYLKKNGYKLGIVTDTDGTPGLKGARMSRLDIVSLFDVVVISGEDTPQTKPDPNPFLLGADKLAVSASECLFFGDKPFTDIEGANAAGMTTVLVKRRDWGAKERADIVIESLTVLRSML
jgi:putative hydrolase of the HAD superfamily